MIQFYSPDIRENPALGEVESGHCCRVLRKSVGDMIRVTDGKGYIYECEITDAHPKHTMVSLKREIEIKKEWPFRLVVALAPTKSIDRMEWLVEKLVEIGVDEIILVRCGRSERKVVKTERLRKIIISAMNQSLKSRLPLIGEMIDFKELIDNYTDIPRYVGYCDEKYPRRDFTDEYLSAGGDALILIGPEGDFTESEITSAIERGYMPVTFGDNRLRTETAALYGAQAVHIINRIRRNESI